MKNNCIKCGTWIGPARKLCTTCAIEPCLENRPAADINVATKKEVRVDWQKHGWTASQQVKKIFEEASEIAKALANGDLLNAIRETLDTKQTCDTMLAILANEWQEEHKELCPMERLEKEYVEKLERKGY